MGVETISSSHSSVRKDSERPEAASYPYEPISTMGKESGNSDSAVKDDIILGRGTVHAKHPGNERFYRIIDAFLPLYVIADSKSKKSVIIKILYDSITKAGQRFLVEEPPALYYMEITEDQAKKKIGHTLRYRKALLYPARVRSTSISSPASKAKTTSIRAQAVDSIPVVSAPSSPARSCSTPGTFHGMDPVPVVSDPSLPDRSHSTLDTTQVEIISEEELNSVLGSPGEMDLQHELSTPFVLQPLLQGFRLDEFQYADMDTLSFW